MLLILYNNIFIRLVPKKSNFLLLLKIKIIKMEMARYKDGELLVWDFDNKTEAWAFVFAEKFNEAR